MAATTYGVTDQGFVRKPLSAIVDSLNSRFKAEFGSTFDTSAESPDGQVIGIVANELSQAWEQAQFAFNSYRPGAVEGEGLDAICELTGAERYVNKPTSVTVYCDGPDGAVQPSGLIVSDGTNEFVTQSDVTLPGDVTAICTQTGAIYVAANTVTKIVSTGAKATTVTNPEEGDTGIVYEQDPSLRARRDKTTVSSGSATAEAIYSGLANLNLSYVRIRDNDTAAAIGEQPANTLWVVVDGGTVNDIAKSIYHAKTGAVPTYGDISTNVTDSKGFPHTIKFSRTKRVNTYFNIKARRLPTANLSSNDVKINIQTAVTEYINSLQPGAPVAWSYLIQPILASTTGIQVDQITIGLSASALAQTTLAMDINMRPYTEADFITVVDTTNT